MSRSGRQRPHAAPLLLPSSSSWSRAGRQGLCRPLLWLRHGSNSRIRCGRQSRCTRYSPGLQQRAAGARTSLPAALSLVPTEITGAESRAPRVVGHSSSIQLRQARLGQGGAPSSQRLNSGSTSLGTSRLPQRAGRLAAVHHSQEVAGRSSSEPLGGRHRSGERLCRCVCICTVL